MGKKSSKIHYGFQGELLSCKDIYARCKKYRGHSRYLLSVPIEIYGGEPEAAPIDLGPAEDIAISLSYLL